MFCVQFIINFELVQILAAAIASQTCVLHKDLWKKASLQLPPFYFFDFWILVQCSPLHDQVLRAFSNDEGSKVSYGLLMSHCAELAEDLLDHALWRVFSAAGEDHRGVLGAMELEKALQAESGSSGADKAGGEAPGPFGTLPSLRRWGGWLGVVNWNPLLLRVLRKQSLDQVLRITLKVFLLCNCKCLFSPVPVVQGLNSALYWDALGLIRGSMVHAV